MILNTGWHKVNAPPHLAGDLSHGTAGSLVQCQPPEDLGRVEGGIGRLELAELRQSLLILGGESGVLQLQPVLWIQIHWNRIRIHDTTKS